jgi:hypothetical protein
MTATSVSIRRAGPHDAPALCRLAALDSAAPLRGEVLMAEVEGEALAALSLGDGSCVADPFAPTAQLVALLRLRRGQMLGTGAETAAGRAGWIGALPLLRRRFAGRV